MWLGLLTRLAAAETHGQTKTAVLDSTLGIRLSVYIIHCPLQLAFF
jgi:hypothetical protein